MLITNIIGSLIPAPLDLENVASPLIIKVTIFAAVLTVKLARNIGGKWEPGVRLQALPGLSCAIC